MSRYARQIVLPGFGEDGQRRLAAASVAVVGVGALGCASAELLARAGIGRLIFIDRDVVELSNLQRQTLFGEQDAAENLPKAEAARRRLVRVNSSIVIEAVVADLRAGNAESLLGIVGDARPSIIVDGTDNFETRFLLNDLAVKHSIPYAYAGVVGTAGTQMTVLPGRGPCLRCMGDMPDAGTSPTCDTAGVLGSAVMIAASAQVADVIRLLVNGEENLRPRMLAFDLWGSGDAGKPRFHSIDATTLGASASCVCCGQRQFEFMRGDCSSDTLSLCGQNAVQITPAPVSNGGDGGSKRLDLDKIASMLRTIGRVTANGYLVRASVPRAGFDGGVLELTVFPDARAILKGTTNPALARAAYAQFVGA